MKRVRHDGPQPMPGAIFYDVTGAVGVVYDAFPDRALVRPLPAPYHRFEIITPEAARELAAAMTGRTYEPRRTNTPIVVSSKRRKAKVNA